MPILVAGRGLALEVIARHKNLSRIVIPAEKPAINDLSWIVYASARSSLSVEKL